MPETSVQKMVRRRSPADPEGAERQGRTAQFRTRRPHVCRRSPTPAVSTSAAGSDAIKAAGLDYDKIRRKSFWSKKKIVERILELKKAGEPLHVSAAEMKYGGLVGAATVYFGSWRKAIKAAGLDYAKIKRQKEWSKEEIVSEIKRMKREGLPLSTTIPVREKYRTLHAAAIRYFGSWAAAMKAAKLEKLLR